METYREHVQKHDCFGYPLELAVLERKGSRNPPLKASHQPAPVKPNIFLLYWKTAAPELNTVLEGNTAKGRTLCSLTCLENHF